MTASPYRSIKACFIFREAVQTAEFLKMSDNRFNQKIAKDLFFMIRKSDLNGILRRKAGLENCCPGIWQ